jgi:uncharacterized protein YbaP (TraB family)
MGTIMRRPFLALLLSLLSLFWLIVPTAWGADRGALFRITQGAHEMHLFGTLHVGLPEFYPLEPRITDAIAKASTLALELDPEQPRAELLRTVRAFGMLAPGAPGYEALSADEKARLNKLILQGGLDAGQALQFKPVLLATMLTMAEYGKQGYRPDLAADRFLARLARQDNVRIMELESLGSQLAMLDRLAQPERLHFLEEMMGTIESGAQKTEAQAMVQAWSTADQRALDAIAARCASDRSVSGRFVNEVLLKERNAALADKLARLLGSENRTVAAIGILHLLGTDGVPALLQARGISVERIY